jgi:hypothetical protein
VDRVALREIIARIGRPRDTSGLFAALGYTPVSEPFDETSQITARWRGFRIVAPDQQGREAVRGLAVRLARGGDRALAVGVDPAGLVLSAPRVGAAGCTRLLAVPRINPPELALEVLEDLRPRARDTALVLAIRIAEVLSSEAAGRQFFQAFRATLDRMAAALHPQAPHADRHLAALLQLTRVLFLYFVQAKGWLAGRPHFLRDTLDGTLSRNQDFHRAVLHPLFFGSLNRRPAERTGRFRRVEVPYLNGGLFEPHPVERRLGPVLLPNELWRDAFDEVFERFRFCVREAEEVNAIAPDMLGHVFERVMDPTERHATGTFYTPEAVVRDLVTATIETALAGRGNLPGDLACRIVRGEAVTGPEARLASRALRRIRILDPAVGSGAFLLGALERLVEMRHAAATVEGVAPRRHRLRRLVLRRSLFGVDRSPVAVRLAELRLWLAVIADDPVADISQVAPLPNLDGIVRQGDSLHDALGALRGLALEGSIVPMRAPAQHAVARARAELFDASGPDRIMASRRLREAELEWAGQAISAAMSRVDQMLADLAAVAHREDLFGRQPGLSREQQALVERLHRHRGALLRALAETADGAVPFFSFEVHAADIMTDGGFDVVVGNPPWVRSERLPAPERRALRERFRWWKSAPVRGFGHQPDLAVAFLERALELTAPGGAVGMLVPSKVASAAYGQAARSHMVRETAIAYLHRVPEHEAAAFGATTYPLAAVFRKAVPDPDHHVRLDFRGTAAVPQRSLAEDGPWVLVPDRVRDALAEFYAAGVSLECIAVPSLGAKTGADRLFVGELRALDQGHALVFLDGAEVRLEANMLRPALRGRDVRPFRAAARRVVVCTHRPSGECLPRLPPRSAAYMEARERPLRARTDYRDGPPWSLFRIRPALAANRVVWPDIARRPMAVALDETPLAHAIPLNTCYVAPAPDRDAAFVAAAVLNSTWATAAALVTADEARGGYRRINARVAGRIPIPRTGSAVTELRGLSVAAHDGTLPDQDELDDAVAEALHLTAATRDALRRLARDHR